MLPQPNENTNISSKYIFIGTIYPKERENEIRSNSLKSFDTASNSFQWALLKGLDSLTKDTIVITAPFIRYYPKGYKQFKFSSSIFHHKRNSQDFVIGFINFPILYHLTRRFTLKKRLKSVFKKNTNIEVIFIYSVHSPFLSAVEYIKKKFPSVKLCLITPDLPKFMSESRNPFYRIFKFFDQLFIKKYLKSIDSFVILSEGMKQQLDIGNRPYKVIEGIYNKNDEHYITQKEVKTILYTGSLDIRYGILNLLAAFNSIDNRDYKLWICGTGGAEKDIIELSKKDKRITFFGLVSHEKSLLLQRKATILINPRTNEGEYTKYSFPSKIIEYFVSGTPTIMNRLEGIPVEYYDYCFIPNGESIENLRDVITQTCEMEQSDLDSIGKKAKDFIISKKNPEVQVKKILELFT